MGNVGDQVHFKTFRFQRLRDKTLDLNGYVVKATSLASFGAGCSIIDSSNGAGRLALTDMNHLSLRDPNYGALPVWAADGSGYVFTTVKEQAEIVRTGDDSFYVNFRPSIKGYLTTSDFLKDGALDNGLTFKVVIHCYNEDGTADLPLAFTISDETVATVYTLTAEGQNKSIQMNIRGAGTMYASYGVEIQIVSVSGVVYSAMLNSTFVPSAQ